MGPATGAESEREMKAPFFKTEKLNFCILTETCYVVFENTPRYREKAWVEMGELM